MYIYTYMYIYLYICTYNPIDHAHLHLMRAGSITKPRASAPQGSCNVYEYWKIKFKF